jgi:2-polyprenyl-3-methyl-5-hydroxy-6-metoxy-1,4-benzoquinol methylase
MNAIPSKEDIQSGAAIYTFKMLPIYDWLVTRFSNRFAWRCPRSLLIQFFRDNISLNHLDIGVGAGYFLQKANLPLDKQRIGLMDLNQDCLNYTAEKLAAYHPETYHQDLYAPINGITRKFDSVSINYVLHCMPGTLPQKAIAFNHIKSVLTPGGKLFGSTILGAGVKHNWLAKKLMRLYNAKKIFCNVNDDAITLEQELKKRFTKVSIKIQGCVALFTASN